MPCGTHKTGPWITQPGSKPVEPAGFVTVGQVASRIKGPSEVGLGM